MSFISGIFVLFILYLFNTTKINRLKKEFAAQAEIEELIKNLAKEVQITQKNEKAPLKNDQKTAPFATDEEIEQHLSTMDEQKNTTAMIVEEPEKVVTPSE